MLGANKNFNNQFLDTLRILSVKLADQISKTNGNIHEFTFLVVLGFLTAKISRTKNEAPLSTTC